MGEEILAGGIGGMVVALSHMAWRTLEKWFDDRIGQRDRRKAAVTRWKTACSSFENYSGQDREMRLATTELDAQMADVAEVTDLCNQMLDAIKDGPGEKWSGLKLQIRNQLRSKKGYG